MSNDKIKKHEFKKKGRKTTTTITTTNEP